MYVRPACPPHFVSGTLYFLPLSLEVTGGGPRLDTGCLINFALALRYLSFISVAFKAALSFCLKRNSAESNVVVKKSDYLVH